MNNLISSRWILIVSARSVLKTRQQSFLIPSNRWGAPKTVKILFARWTNMSHLNSPPSNRILTNRSLMKLLSLGMKMDDCLDWIFRFSILFAGKCGSLKSTASKLSLSNQPLRGSREFLTSLTGNSFGAMTLNNRTRRMCGCQTYR